jgi:hypothetical protein
MVCQNCLEKRERSQKLGFSQNKRNLNDNFLSLNSARKVGVNMHLEHKKFGYETFFLIYKKILKLKINKIISV